MPERYFQLDEYWPQDAWYGPGLLQDAGSNVDFVSLPAEDVIPQALAIRKVAQQTVRALSVLGKREAQPLDKLSIDFSAHLRQVRSEASRMDSTVCITGAERLDATSRLAEFVHVPHFVTVVGRGVLSDQVIWETQTEEQYVTWRGPNSVDLTFVESNLSGIICLRRMARSNQLMGSESLEKLRSRLDQGRYLSALFICENQSLIEDAIGSMGAA